MNSKVILSILVASLVTIMLRFVPFILFKKKTPRVIEELGGMLPYAIMAMLVVYCLKDINILSGNRGTPEIVSCIVVIVSYKLKHNILLSIVLSTIIYMIMIAL